jgi:hypothetical protein
MVMKKIIGLFGGVLYVAFSLEGATTVAPNDPAGEAADNAGLLTQPEKRDGFSFPHRVKFKHLTDENFNQAITGQGAGPQAVQDRIAALRTSGKGFPQGIAAYKKIKGDLLETLDENDPQTKKLIDDIAARDLIKRMQSYYEVVGDVEAVATKRKNFNALNPVQIPLALAEKWTGVYGRNKDLIDSSTKLFVIGSALAFMFNKFGGSEYVRNKIRELFDKPTIYTIRRRKTGFFGSKSNDNLVKPEDLILPMSTRKQVNELMFLINRRYEMSKTSKRKLPLPHVLLYGPPGTGKTTIAQMIADNTIGDDGQPMKLISLMASDFMQIKAEGDRLAVLKKMFTEAIQMRNTIIFLDEIDALLKQRGGPNESSNRACVDMLLFYTVKLSADYMVIGGTNHLKDMDEAALSRFRRKIGIPLPSLRNRKLILELYVRDKLISKSYTSQLDIAAIAGIMVGASGRDLESFVTRLRDRIDFENGNTATPALAEVILSEMGYLEGKASDIETFYVEDDFIQK